MSRVKKRSEPRGSRADEKKDIDRILAIAARYGVDVFLIKPKGIPHSDDLITDDRGLPWMERSEVPRTATKGPNGHYCCVRSLRVWYEHLDPWRCEELLHELCHVLMQPPGNDIHQLSEDVVLMPFERTLARQFLSLKGYRRVIDWQEITQIEWWDEKRSAYYDALDEVPNYTRWFFWRQSFAALRRMGAIKNGRVTWRWPNWKRATKPLLARGNLSCFS